MVWTRITEANETPAGDGVTDDTVAFQRALDSTVGKILFVDAGSYILTGTITVPVGSKIVGETWSQLVARGSYFGDARHVSIPTYDPSVQHQYRTVTDY